MVIRKVLQGEKVTIHSYPDKETAGSRFYLHARNHADALLFLLKNGKADMFGDGSECPSRYNVVGEKEVDNLTMAKMIALFVGKPL